MRGGKEEESARNRGVMGKTRRKMNDTIVVRSTQGPYADILQKVKKNVSVGEAKIDRVIRGGIR